MKKIALLLAGILICNAVSAQKSFEFKNSEDGESVLYAYLPAAEKATGRAVICCPGGGYGFLAISYEGHWWKDFFNDRGIAFFVLKYRMPHGDRSIPLTDAANALYNVRKNAEEWNINPNDVGVMGFSAGGHLATMMATRTELGARPAFQILFYPVTSLDSWGGHQGTADNFLGADVRNRRTVMEYSADKQVKKHTTPPAIIFCAADDNVVPPSHNALAYATAMMQAENEAQLHIYPSGGHGWDLSKDFEYGDEILDALDDWLTKLPASTSDAVKVACIGDSITDGHMIFVNYRYGYPALLQKYLGENYLVKNFGVSGRCVLKNSDNPYTNEVAWKEAKEFNPDIAVIKLGTNDSKPQNWKYKDEFKADLQAMIDELNALESHPKIYLCLPAHAYQNPYNIVPEVIQDEIIPMIREVAAADCIEIIDLNTAIKDKSFLQPDYTHPNNRGVEKMAEVVSEAVLPQVKSSDIYKATRK